MRYRTQIKIDAKALLHNVRRVKYFVPNTRIIAMIKANAYGHGVSSVGQVLAPEVDIFGVACLKEALELQNEMLNKPILLMGGVSSPQEWPVVWSHQFNVVLHQPWQVESLLKFLSKRKKTRKTMSVWVKIDTGMHRLGLLPEEVPEIYERLIQCPLINPSIGFMTHFACADEIKNPLTLQQMRLFDKILKSLAINPEHTKRSLANSAGVIAWPETHGHLSLSKDERYALLSNIEMLGGESAENQAFDSEKQSSAQYLNYVRPGIMLYGISPFADKMGADFGLRPVMSLKSHIIAIKTCKKSESVGYGATWKAPEDCLIAIVAAGYGDGYPRHISDEAVVWVDGHYLPIVGRVSMDMLAINISSWLEAKIGAAVELWGPHLPVEQVAKFSNTSPYELVSQVTSRARVKV